MTISNTATTTKTTIRNIDGNFGEYGGAFVPEPLKGPLKELENAFVKYVYEEEFQKELKYYQREYIGRSNPLYFAENLTSKVGGAKIYLKREDLNHTGGPIKLTIQSARFFLQNVWAKRESLLKQALDNTVLQQQQCVPFSIWTAQFTWAKKIWKDKL